MIRKRPLFILLLLSVVLLSSYSQEQKRKGWSECRPKPESLKLQKEVIEMLIRNPIYNRDTLLAALELCNRAIQLDSSFWMAYENKAEIHARLGQRAEAIQAVLEYKPNSPESVVRAGMLTEQGGDTLQARRYYEQALALNMGEERPYYFNERAAMSSQCFIKVLLHRQAEALADWDRLTREYPVDSAEQEETRLIRAMIEMFPRDSVVRTFWQSGSMR